MGLRAQRKQPTTGREGLVGEIGKVVEPLTPSGKIFLQGEYWFADCSSGESIEIGTAVRVTAVQGMRLKVKRIDSSLS